MVSIRHFIILTIICAIESSILRKFGDRNKRIVNGKRVPKGHAPFSASLQIIVENDLRHFCSATYLGQGIVLTASHCLRNIKACEIMVQIGTNQLSKVNTTKYSVSKALKKQYDVYTFNNDIALLKLNMSKNDELYDKEYVAISDHYEFEIDHCNIYGYGATQFLGPHSNYLLYGSVKPINRTRCLSSLGSVTTPNYRMGMFCGEGKHGVDACGGDSGGGMICTSKRHNASYIIGIVSYGVGCGSTAGVYTSPIHHIAWIEQNLEILLTG